MLAELADGLAGTRSRVAAIDFIDALREDWGLRIVPAGRKSFDAGWELYRRRQDKEWMLTDCISFEVMRKAKLTEALTGDQHFEQAGLRTLLKQAHARRNLAITMLECGGCDSRAPCRA